MRSSTIIATSLSVLLLPISAAVQIPARFEPFFPSHLDDVLLSNDTLIPGEEHELLKRANNCPSNYNSCSTFSAAASGACCTKNSICTTDGNRNIACCPTGATCTGTIASQTAVATTSATVTATYVSNIYFPFPSIPTSYDNSAACTSAYSACQSNYALCTQDLSGNGFGVTVSAIGGGITIAPSGTNVGYSSATSICSSLSSEACQGLETSMCAQYGTASTTTSGATTTSGNTVFIVGATSNAAPRPTMGCMAAAGVMAGFGLGMAGRIA